MSDFEKVHFRQADVASWPCVSTCSNSPSRTSRPRTRNPARRQFLEGLKEKKQIDAQLAALGTAEATE